MPTAAVLLGLNCHLVLPSLLTALDALQGHKSSGKWGQAVKLLQAELPSACLLC